MFRKRGMGGGRAEEDRASPIDRSSHVGPGDLSAEAQRPGSLSSLQDMPWPGHMPFGSPAGMIYPLEPPTGGMEQLKLRPLSLVVSLASHHFWICVAQVRIFRALWTQRGYSEWSLLRRIQL